MSIIIEYNYRQLYMVFFFVWLVAAAWWWLNTCQAKMCCCHVCDNEVTCTINNCWMPLSSIQIIILSKHGANHMHHLARCICTVAQNPVTLPMSTHIYQRSPHWMNFCEIWYWGLHENVFRKSQYGYNGTKILGTLKI